MLVSTNMQLETTNNLFFSKFHTFYEDTRKEIQIVVGDLSKNYTSQRLQNKNCLVLAQKQTHWWKLTTEADNLNNLQPTFYHRTTST